ncbi:hypothetical protein [Echinicola salinicaeni]|uniref:hypothetical protein n=1 Tax=Echinicola salinicaeni TaxID=2762757 RepID=UPI00164660EC|nr:hypothetical protein [Echinicola salinicaeni]
MTKQAFSLLMSFVLLAGCAGGSKISRSAAAYNNYQEDLSYNRITYPDLPKENSIAPESNGPISAEAGDPVDADLEQALTSFSIENEERGTYNGFTILVYSGVDREQAFSVRNDLYNTLPSEVKAEMEYEQPRYLVKVGQYLYRIEAHSLFHTIKKDFPTARIIRQRFGKAPEEEEPEEGEIIEGEDI